MAMKSLVISSLLLLFALGSAKAQNFAPVGAKWYYTQYEFTGSGVGFTWFESVKDTIVNGRACRKLEWGGNPCAWPSQFVYDSNDSVFFYHSQRDEFCFLYDFGASIGDIWTVYHLGQDSTVLLVDSVGTALIDGISLRVIHTSIVNQWENFWQFSGTMTEKIGADYLFPVIGVCDPVPGELRCYQDSVLSFHQGPYECDEVVTSVLSTDVENELRVYPNPTSDACHLRFPPSWAAAGTVSIDVVNSIVATVLSTAVSPKQGTATIGVGHLGPGLYTIRLRTSGQQHAYLKLVVR